MVRYPSAWLLLFPVYLAHGGSALADTIVIEARNGDGPKRLTYFGHLESMDQRYGIVRFFYTKEKADRLLEVHFSRIQSLSIDGLYDPVDLGSPAYLKSPLSIGRTSLRTIEFADAGAVVDDHQEVRWNLRPPPGARATGSIRNVDQDHMTIRVKEATKDRYVVKRVERASFRRWHP